MTADTKISTGPLSFTILEPKPLVYSHSSDQLIAPNVKLTLSLKILETVSVTPQPASRHTYSINLKIILYLVLK